MFNGLRNNNGELIKHLSVV